MSKSKIVSISSTNLVKYPPNDADRIRALDTLLRYYNLDAPDGEEAILYFEPNGDDQSPHGYFGLETPHFYITGDSLAEIADRLIFEENILNSKK
jgi:hypothetical protein